MVVDLDGDNIGMFTLYALDAFAKLTMTAGTKQLTYNEGSLRIPDSCGQCGRGTEASVLFLPSLGVTGDHFQHDHDH